MKNSTTYMSILFVLSIFQMPIHSIGAEESSKSNENSAERYLVTLSEYCFHGAASPKLGDSEILEMIASQKLVPVETIRISTMSGFEAMAQFGKQVTVTTGRSGNRDGTTRITKQMPIGTILRVVAKPQGSEVLLNIQFESSRFDGEGTDDSPPDMVTNRISTSQLFLLDKPTLVGGTSVDKSSYAVVSVLKLPQPAR